MSQLSAKTAGQSGPNNCARPNSLPSAVLVLRGGSPGRNLYRRSVYFCGAGQAGQTSRDSTYECGQVGVQGIASDVKSTVDSLKRFVALTGCAVAGQHFFKVVGGTLVSPPQEEYGCLAALRGLFGDSEFTA